MSMTDTDGYPYALVSNVVAGTVLVADGSFIEFVQGNPMFVHEDPDDSSLYVKGEKGNTYLSSFIDESGDSPVYHGLYTQYGTASTWQFAALLSVNDTILKIKHVINTYSPGTFPDALDLDALPESIIKGRMNFNDIPYDDLNALGFLENPQYITGMMTASRAPAPTPDGNTYFLIPAELKDNLPIGMIYHKLEFFNNEETGETTIAILQDTGFISITNYRDDTQYVGVGYNPEFQVITFNGKEYLNVALPYRPNASTQYIEESNLPPNPFIPPQGTPVN